MVLTLHLFEVVAHEFEEWSVRGENVSTQVELDHGLRTVDGAHLAGVIVRHGARGRDVGRHLDDLVHVAILVHHGRVGTIDPDLATRLADAAKIAVHLATGPEHDPEVLVASAVGVRSVAKHAVM
ncbi:hypothetical protein QCE47_16335 [Caballeronia sp. LZ025]|nr:MULTISPECIES: hypothetical protein [Caballeronia]MDR5733898.1 hypothetical protein [Caballeronia sp. LZ025]